MNVLKTRTKKTGGRFVLTEPGGGGHGPLVESFDGVFVSPKH
jgi:hypothetical protein